MGAAHTGVWLARMLSRHRAPVAAILVRVMWLAALVLLVEAGRSVFDVTAALNTDATLTDFFTGLGLCAATVALAQARRIRWAAIALGTVHGGLALLLWSAAAAT